MKLVAWLGGPEIEVSEVSGESWVAPHIVEEEGVVLLSMNLWITLNGGLFVPIEVDE